MRRSDPVSLVLGVLLLLPGAVLAHTHGVLEAVQVATPPVVDGRLSDWTGFAGHLGSDRPDWFMGPSRVSGAPAKDGREVEAWFSACWTKDRLYLAVLVFDDRLVRSLSPDAEAAHRKADCVDWHLDLNHDASHFVESRAPTFRADDLVMRMIPFEKQSGIKGGFFLVAQGGASVGYKAFQKYTSFASRAVTVGGRGGYAMEASLDLDRMGFPGLTRPGALMGFDLSVHDADSSAGWERTLTWSSWGGRSSRDSTCFGDLLLTDEDGSFPVSSGDVGAEEAGYYLHPGKPRPVRLLDAASGKPGSLEGLVEWSGRRVPSGSNLSAFFDPSPFRPLNRPAIRYCQVGYQSDSRKWAFLETPVDQEPEEEVFTLIADGKPVLSKRLVRWGTLWNRDYHVLDFSTYTGAGRACVIQVGKTRTGEFPIRRSVYDPLAGLALGGFFRAQRCGKAAPPYHSACHLKDALPAPPDAIVDRQPVLQFPPAYGMEERIDVTGGFHDDGRTGKNMSRFPVALDFMLLAADEFNPKVDADHDLTPDLLAWLREAFRWGLKMQDKDGGMFERVVDAKERRWLDTDKWADVTARWVATAALGAHVLERVDPALSGRLEQSALRGWAYMARNQNQPARPCMTGCYPEHPASSFWAGVELHRLTLEPSYLEASLKRLPSVIEGELEPMSWRGSQILALLRLYPLLPENQAKARIRRALANHLKRLREQSARNPFGVRYVASFEEGNNATLLATAVEIFYLQRVFPKLDAYSLIEPYRQWVYGANPSGYSFVVGRGDRTPQFQSTQTEKPLPGSVVPGIVDDGQGFPLYLDFPTFRQANEAALDAAAANLFLSFVRAPFRGTFKAQIESEADLEALKATEKPLRPVPGAVLDLNSLSAGSFWRNGSGDWSVRNTMTDTDEGRAFRCEFKTGEWVVTGISLEGDWSPYKGLSLMARGNGARLKLVLDDPDGEDWSTEISLPAAWTPVRLPFADLRKPSWKEKIGNGRRDFEGPKTMKIQVLGPARGWFELLELNLYK